MKDILLDSIINNIKKYYNYNDVKLKEIRYGLESLYLSVIKVIVIIILSIFIHIFDILCMFFVTYGLLRLICFGLHTKKSIQCWLLSITTFLLIPYLIKTITISDQTLLLSSIILLILIGIYSPADTEKRPLIHKRKRIIYKILSIIITSIYLLIICLTKNILIKNLLFFSILLETILILPTSYKILGLKYDNYKSYKRKED